MTTIQRRLRVVSFGEEAQEMERTVKVAFATSDRRSVDQHFGAAEAFAIYRVDPAHAALVEATQFGRLSMDGNEDKLAAKIAALEGCVAVYCQAVGASAVNQLLAAGIQPLKVPAGTPVSDLVDALRAELRDGPSAWLSRAMRLQAGRAGDRFDDMEAEGWSE